jgi:hypothetical protein
MSEWVNGCVFVCRCVLLIDIRKHRAISFICSHLTPSGDYGKKTNLSMCIIFENNERTRPFDSNILSQLSPIVNIPKSINRGMFANRNTYEVWTVRPNDLPTNATTLQLGQYLWPTVMISSPLCSDIMFVGTS